KAQRRDQQMALIKALGGGFDAHDAHGVNLVAPTQVGSDAKGVNGQSDVNGGPWRDAPWTAPASSAPAATAAN
ncbi:hypothetical protein B0G62_1562, partial [Paraburkholderia eburnea]